MEGDISMIELLHHYDRLIRRNVEARLILQAAFDNGGLDEDGEKRDLDFLDDEFCDSYKEFLNPKDLKQAKENINLLHKFFLEAMRAHGKL